MKLLQQTFMYLLLYLDIAISFLLQWFSGLFLFAIFTFVSALTALIGGRKQLIEFYKKVAESNGL